MNEWEAQINALLDGELDDAAAESLKAEAEHDPALARAIIEAYQLQRLLAEIPQERAPDSLRARLQRIPAEQESAERRIAEARKSVKRSGRRPRWFEPRWAMALAALPLVVALGIQFSGPKEPTDAELAQARQDLALAFAYLEKASRVTEREIEHSIGAGMRDPVTETTARAISEQFDMNEERDS
jgi:anti-sigma factor RsiW